MAINKVSDGKKEAISKKSAQFLPNNPSGRGMSADDIKKAFYAPVTDTADSILSEIDRVVDEANAALDRRVKVKKSNTAVLYGEDSRGTVQYTPHIDPEGSTIVRRSPKGNIYAKTVDDDPEYEDISNDRLVNVGYGDERYAQKHCPSKGITRIWVSDGENGYWMKTCHNRQDQALVGNIPFYVPNNYGQTVVTGHLITGVPINPYQAANQKYVDDSIDVSEREMLDAINYFWDYEVYPRVSALETAASGNSRSYVIEGLDELQDLLNGTLEGFDYSKLITGDNILLRQLKVPDFWFERSESAEAPTYTYVEYDDTGDVALKKEYALSVKKGVAQIGVLHELEVDYNVIDGKVQSAHQYAEDAEDFADEAQTAADEARKAANEAIFAKESLNDALNEYVRKEEAEATTESFARQISNLETEITEAKESIGNIETALDELHEYAQAIIDSSNVENINESLEEILGV